MQVKLKPNGLSSKSILWCGQSGRHADRQNLTVYEFLKFDNLNSTAYFGCLKGFIM